MFFSTSAKNLFFLCESIVMISHKTRSNKNTVSFFLLVLCFLFVRANKKTKGTEWEICLKIMNDKRNVVGLCFFFCLPFILDEPITPNCPWNWLWTGSTSIFITSSITSSILEMFIVALPIRDYFFSRFRFYSHVLIRKKNSFSLVSKKPDNSVVLCVLSYSL